MELKERINKLGLSNQLTLAMELAKRFKKDGTDLTGVLRSLGFTRKIIRQVLNNTLDE
jgi:ribosomal 50S subunit-associated protein YjgA (DUF615 family)